MMVRAWRDFAWRLLWVQVADKAAEERVLGVLRDCGGGSVHTHMIDRSWGVDLRGGDIFS